MSNVISESRAGGSTSDGFEVFANLNDGFLGMGYSSSVEVSFIAMALIFGYIVIGTVRYFLPEIRFYGAIVEALGLRDS